MQTPLISILSTFKNNKAMMKVVMDSVLSQNYSNIEHVITDSASTDGSVDTLKSYEQKYAQKGYSLVWTSKPDHCIAEGINKAIRLMRGSYFMLLFDPFVSYDSLNTLVCELITGKYDGAYGGSIYQKNGVIIRRWSGKGGHWRFGWMAASEAFCMKRDIVEKHGMFNEKYKTAEDYDYQIRLFRDKTLNFFSVPIPIVNYLAGGTSNGGLKNNFYSITTCYKILKNQGVKFAFWTVLCKCAIAFFAYLFSPKTKVPPELAIRLE
jgi:glycosyltransferase